MSLTQKSWVLRSWLLRCMMLRCFRLGILNPTSLIKRNFISSLHAGHFFNPTKEKNTYHIQNRDENYNVLVFFMAFCASGNVYILMSFLYKNFPSSTTTNKWWENFMYRIISWGYWMNQFKLNGCTYGIYWPNSLNCTLITTQQVNFSE